MNFCMLTIYTASPVLNKMNNPMDSYYVCCMQPNPMCPSYPTVSCRIRWTILWVLTCPLFATKAYMCLSYPSPMYDYPVECIYVCKYVVLLIR